MGYTNSEGVVSIVNTQKLERENKMEDHKHGSMDISEQEKTYTGFIKVTIWTTIAIILILVFMALVNS